MKALLLAALLFSAPEPAQPVAAETSPEPKPPLPHAPVPSPAQQPSRTAPPPADAARPSTPPPGGSRPGAAAQSAGPCIPLQGRFLLAFNKAEVVDLLEQASRWMCHNFAYTEETARGKITLLSKTPVTAEEAYAAFLAALTANGIAVYPSGKFYKLVRVADAKKMPIPTLLDDGTEVPALEQPTTKVIRLRFADADQLRGILGNFTSPQGADIQSIPPDLLIVTDVGLNIRRIERLIEAIDRPGSADAVRIIPVQFAPARDVAEKVNQVFAQQPSTPGRTPGRRALAAGVAPGQPGAPAPKPAGGPEQADLSISKVLADERTNKLIVIADEKGFQRIAELVKQLDVPMTGDGGIHVVMLKNANADELAQTLQALAQGQAAARRGTGGPTQALPTGLGSPPPSGLSHFGNTARTPGTTAELFSGEVKITADKPTNSLVVLASGGDFASLMRLVERLDRPRRQVFVEAVIMEVNLNNENQLGVGMHAAVPYSNSDGTGYIPLASEPGRINSLTGGLTSAASLGGFLTGLVAPIPAELSSVLPSGVTSLEVLIQALQTSNDVNVLSTPHLLASDNEESEITVGQNVPFQAGYSVLGSTTSSTTTSTTVATALGISGLSSLYAPIQRQNVELKLKIKPQIGDGDTVRLDLEEQTEEIASKDATLGPTTAKRSVKTRIVAKDQTTVVIGGLIQERTIQSVHKIPLLGDIPIIGWLFRDTDTTKAKTNLLLFLTPYIIRDDSDYRRILERKQREHEQFAESFQRARSGYQVPVDYRRKPGPYARMRKEIQSELQKVENGGPGAPGERLMSPPQQGVPAEPRSPR